MDSSSAASLGSSGIDTEISVTAASNSPFLRSRSRNASTRLCEVELVVDGRAELVVQVLESGTGASPKQEVPKSDEHDGNQEADQHDCAGSGS